MTGGRESQRAVTVALVVGLILLVPLAGCGRATPTPQATTISFACLDEDLGYYEAVARAFAQSHPTVRVRILPKRQLALQVLAPGESDAMVVSLPLEPRLEQGGLLAADGRLAQRDDFYPCALSAVTRDGRIWAVPIGVDPVLMYYNRDLFAAGGVAYPSNGWSWQDFLDTARKLRDRWGGIYGYGAGLWPEESLLFVLQNGGRLADDWQKPTRFTFDDAQAVQALDWYAQLIFQYDVAPNAYEVEQAFAERGIFGGIVDGKVGMWAGYYSSRLDEVGGSTVNWGAVALPAGREEVTLATVEAVAVSARATHPELCWQWADYLSRQVPRRMAPVRRSVTRSQAFIDSASTETAAAIDRALEHALVLPQAPAAFYRKMNSLWATVLDDLVHARTDAANALQQAQRQAGR